MICCLCIIKCYNLRYVPHVVLCNKYIYMDVLSLKKVARQSLIQTITRMVNESKEYIVYIILCLTMKSL